MAEETTGRVPSRAQLLRDLGDVDVAVRVRAARAVAAVRPDDIFGELRAALVREQDVEARTAMMGALVVLGGDELLRAVARSLRSADAAVVAGAARVLAAVGDRRVVPNLVEAFRTDDVVVGAAVAEALGRLGDPVVFPWLAAAADQGFCVESACRALGRIGDRRAVPVLRRFVDDDDRRIRLAAREALQRFEEQPPGATPASGDDPVDVDDDAGR